MIWPFEGLERGRFGAIVCDPPWSWKSWSKTNQTRAAENHYALMSDGGIKGLPVADLAAPDCVLFLWSINTMLPLALETMEAWGFRFSTVAFTWAKQNPSGDGMHMGLGYWTRQNTEQVLLGVRGKPQRMGRDVRQLIVSPRRAHSRKPDEVYASIERLVPGPYVDLFARQERPNWVAFGLESTKFNQNAAGEQDAAHVSL